MVDELENISKETFEAAMPRIVYAPYQTIVSEVTVTSSLGTFTTRQKAYSRLVHGRLEQEIRASLKKYRGENIPEVFDTVKDDIFDLINHDFVFGTPNIQFPVYLNLDDCEIRISQNGNIDILPVRKIECIELKIEIRKDEE